GAAGFSDAEGMLPENATLTAADAERRLQAAEGIEAVYLAESAGRAVGLVSLRLVPYLDQDVPYAEVMNLYVRPEARRGGVARAWVADAERVSRARGATAVHILTDADNQAAHAFYRAAGYDMPHVSFQKVLMGAADA